MQDSAFHPGADGDLIGAYVYCPLCGSRDLIRGKGPLLCKGCGHRDFNNPVTAVAAFVFNPHGRVLLIRRAKEPGMGKWAPPGGFLNAGETPETAAIREVQEECGVQAFDLEYLCAFPNSYVYQGLGRPVCDVFFTARMHDAPTIRLQSEEACSFRQLMPSEIDPGELAFESMRRALPVLRRNTPKVRPS